LKSVERENMKMRTLKLTPKFLVEALQGKAASFITNLPGDAQLLDLKFDLCTNQLFVVIRSDSFDDIAELYPIPELKLVYSATPKTATQPTLASKPAESKPAVVAKPQAKPAKKVSTQPRLTTNAVEQEFTREQRKLLSFNTEDDCVVVKPTQFLKSEWDDINAVVKSLGGKWVKGDIISYWEIPMQ
jgi:hypothetical protein